VRRLPFITTALALMVAVLPGGKPAGASTLPATLYLSGRGWGHGRGMGQYGAYGYAVSGQSYTWILDHYYGTTTMGSVGSPNISVHLVELDGQSSVTVKDSSNNVHTVSAGQTFTPSSGDVWVAWPGGSWRAFQGSIQVLSNNQTVNIVSLESYVRGVVPGESPASWGASNGEAALQAQAVAARSYAWAYTGGGTTAICDTTSCQVYYGDPDVAGAIENGSYTQYSDQAQSSTSGQVRVWSSGNSTGRPVGSVALTEFSSSTGGYTAGGAFPAVVDAGDATSSNPNHTWTASISTGSVQQAFPSVGTLQSVAITQRNGLGDMGGRVTQMVLTGSAGRATVTGDQFEWAMGLKSDWFSITNVGASGGVDGYWVVANSGGVYPFGSAPSYGSMAGTRLNAPVIGMAPTGDGVGYWLVARDGGIFTFGDAAFYGSTGAIHLNSPVLGMASTHDTRGYWLYAGDGGIFTFGDAAFYGSLGATRLNKPVVGMASTPTGNGYWLVAADGGIFTFGDAGYYGSTGATRLNQPIVGMVPTADGKGYWLVGRDGGIFTFGDASYVGSLPGNGISDTVTGVSPTADGGGYLMVSLGGRVYSFGDAPYMGDPASTVSGWASQALGVFAHKAQ
jgi:SpoIID/LytB domain protein